ncbi:MAG: YmdB family metallophosphoesterase [Candidatus Riflebacteria bacterium]|nr:YmdB family metallophosphoesterase [Candidatus Riflebacteria bacterium]
MLAIAFTGVIQHEVEQAQLRRLTASVRSDAGTGCIIACNANGLFASASRLDAQIEMLFDSGIDVVFLGEQSIGRNAGRSALSGSTLPLVRPLNLPDAAPGRGAVLFNSQHGPFWMLSVADGTGKIPVALPHLALKEFFGNKTDSFPVVLNVDGTDYEYREALLWKFAARGLTLLLFGSGCGFMAALNEPENVECFFQPDVGVVVSDKSIGGLTPDSWWQRSVERVPVSPVAGWGLLRCDYTIVWLDENKRPQKHMQKTVKL